MGIFANRSLTLSCGWGIAPYLRQEVEKLGYKVLSSHERGVEVQAEFKDAPRLNLCLRTALHVLYLLKRFTSRTGDDLYREITALPWEEIISPSEYLSVVSAVETKHINNSMFASQRVKDAVVDRIAKMRGSRPSSGPKRDNVVINLFWKDDQCWLYLNTTGDKLSDRAYRKIPHTAPIQETLAAALLLAAGYDGSIPFVNPMCGSGTLAIEAALIALRRAPGLLRDNFGFMHLNNFDEKSWHALRGETRKSSLDKLPSKIIASDIDPRAVEIAEKNAFAAGVDKMIEFHACDFAATPLPETKGIIVLNPEYGIRLGKESELGIVYKNIGSFFKQKCAGFTGYVFTGNPALAKQVGLKPSRRLTFLNARIECQFLEYPLYAGSKKSDVRERSDNAGNNL